MKLASVLRLGVFMLIAAVLVLVVAGFVVHETRQPAHSAVNAIVKKIREKTIPKAQRTVSGIVRVAFTVQPDGQATNVHVTGAVPKGYYEKQAIQRIKNHHYKPMIGKDGQPRASVESKIFHFTVPVHQSQSASAPGNG